MEELETGGWGSHDRRGAFLWRIYRRKWRGRYQTEVRRLASYAHELQRGVDWGACGLDERQRLASERLKILFDSIGEAYLGIGGYCNIACGTLCCRRRVGDWLVDCDSRFWLRPGLPEEFSFAALETLSEPLLCSRIGEREAV